jgi:hypothetical protein
MDDLEIGFMNFSRVRYSLVVLSNYLNSCKTCMIHSLNDMPNHIMEDTDTSEGEQTDDESEQGEPVAFHPQKTASAIQGNPIIYSGQLPKVFDVRDFDIQDDDYLSAPIQSQNMQPTDKNIWVFGRDGIQVLPNCWTFWRDQGFRTHSTSFRTLPLDDSETDVDVCLNPFSPKDKCEPLNSTDGKSLVLSAKSFLDEAGPLSGTKESKRVFLRGKERGKGTLQNPAKYLILDLEKDHIPVPTDEIDISVDLDSLIWVTNLENFKAHIFELCLTPSWEQNAGFSTHNFVYVNLVFPPNDEQELRKPKSRLVQDVRLSRIPHLRLGFCGEGQRRINFYIFFPRMIRKNQKNRYATLLPLAVQELWFDNVVIPSCHKAFEDAAGFSEYILSSLAEHRHRCGDKRQKHMVFCDATTIENLMKAIQLSIKGNPDLLSCFGSCFIVADGRGMKLATKQCVPGGASRRSYSTDFKLVQNMLSDLCWDQMLSRDKGELYLDMGVSFHSRYKDPLVGLWRLPSLRESFDSMGTKKGTVHHLSTLGFYGGIKAEMQLKRKQETHLVSRINYCLAFELVRNPSSAEYLCGDKDLINRSKKFVGACKNWMELFLSGSTRSFGVRDEIRGLAHTILDHLPNAVEQASPTLEKKILPITDVVYRPRLVFFLILYFGLDHLPSFCFWKEDLPSSFCFMKVVLTLICQIIA